jgi:hypothetical protein
MNKPLVAACAGVAFGGVLTAALFWNLSDRAARCTRSSRVVFVEAPMPVRAAVELPLTGSTCCQLESVPDAESRFAADELLTMAQRAYDDGNYPCALGAAKKARRVEPIRAWRLMGAVGCQQGDAELADRAFLRVDLPSRHYLIAVCAQHGLAHERGRFRSAE